MPTTETPRYYQPSGTVSMPGAAAMLVAGLSVAAVSALPLVALPQFMESVLVAMACGIGQGFLVGYTVRYTGRFARMRNPDFARMIGLLSGGFAVYFSWVAFIWILNDLNLFVLRDRIDHPLHIVNDMKNIAVQGMWSIAGYTPRGWQLYAIWIAEATSVICLSVVASADDADTYCESCSRWTRDSGMLIRLPSGEPDSLRAALEEQEYQLLDTLRLQSYDARDCFELKIAECENCLETNFLSIQHVIETKDSEGHPQRTEKPVVTNLVVPRSLVEHLRLPVFEGSPQYEPADVLEPVAGPA